MSERGRYFLRKLDAIIGIPSSAIIGALKRKRHLPSRIQSIGILMLGVIGDTLLASATFHDLRRHYPKARLVAFISRANEGTLDLLDNLDEVHVVSATQPWSALRTLRRYPVDVLIDIGQWARISALLAVLSGARYVIGFRTPGQYRHFGFDAVAHHSNERHELDNFRSLVSAMGISAIGIPTLRSDIMSEARAHASNQTIILHPWAAGYLSHLREWPTERWTEVAYILLADGYSVAITGGPADRPRAILLANAIGPARVGVLAGSTSLRETAVALARAVGVISVNTGIMHLAAIVGAPLVALHGPTNPKRWGPVGRNAVVLGPGPEQGCAFLNLGFEYPKTPPDCMGKILVEDVISSMRRLLVDCQKN